MIHPMLPVVLASVLVGLGVVGVLVRRNAVLVVIGVELILAGALVLLVTAGLRGGAAWSSAGVLPLFIITIAAAEVVLALALVFMVFRVRGRIDLDEAREVDDLEGAP